MPAFLVSVYISVRCVSLFIRELCFGFYFLLFLSLLISPRTIDIVRMMIGPSFRFYLYYFVRDFCTIIVVQLLHYYCFAVIALLLLCSYCTTIVLQLLHYFCFFFLQFKHILLYQYTKGLGMATLRHKPSPDTLTDPQQHARIDRRAECVDNC